MASPRENRNGKRRKTASSSAAAAPSASKRAVITEMQSAHSMVIDEAGPVEIVRATRACEAEIFSGFRGYPSMMDKSVHRKLEEAAALVAGADLVVFSGAGTSGRLCWAACQLLERKAKSAGRRVLCTTSLAGGNRAFKKAVEHAEDDAKSASEALERILEAHPGTDPSKVVLVGVSCGMSATWVASQILRSLDLGGKAILLGFTPFEGCRGLFAEDHVKRRLASSEESVVILDPVVGPELVTGSTRLKSGTATKICLEIVVLLSLQDLADRENSQPSWHLKNIVAQLQRRAARMPTPKSLLGQYRSALGVYDSSLSLLNDFMIDSHPLSVGAATLREKGRIIYAGYGREGVLGLIDASEQLPTFGCQEDDFQGFLLDGKVDEDVLAVVGEERTLPHFLRTLEGLGRRDTVVLIFNLRRLAMCPQSAHREALRTVKEVLAKAKASLGFSVVAVLACPTDLRLKPSSPLESLSQVLFALDSVVDFFLEDPGQLGCCRDFDLAAEAAIKSALNCFSSGANILNGKVFGNVMIDVRISNKKLLERATKIVMMVAEVDRMAALESVMRVLGVGHLDGRALRALQAKHGEAVDPSIHFSSQDLQLCIDRGSALRRVVPAAVLLATGRCAEVGEARKTLEFWQDPSNGGRTLRDIVKG